MCIENVFMYARLHNGISNNRYYGITVNNVFRRSATLHVNSKYLDYYKDVMFKYIKFKLKLTN